MLDKKKFDKEVNETLSIKEPISHNVQLKNGKVIERRVDPIFKNGNFAGWIARFRDITSEKKKKAK